MQYTNPHGLNKHKAHVCVSTQDESWLIGVSKDFLGRLHQLLSGPMPPAVILLFHLAIPARGQMRRHGRNGGEGHIRAVGRKWNTGLGGSQSESVNAAIEDRGLNTR